MRKRILVALLAASCSLSINLSVFAMNTSEEKISTRFIERQNEEDKMILVHAVTEREWNECSSKEYYGEDWIEKDGFIHCSTIDGIVEVANDNLKKIQEPMLLLCIDTDFLESEVIWEKRGDKNKEFPHI